MGDGWVLDDLDGNPIFFISAEAGLVKIEPCEDPCFLAPDQVQRLAELLMEAAQKASDKFVEAVAQ